jgi:hypothetical protein
VQELSEKNDALQQQVNELKTIILAGTGNNASPQLSTSVILNTASLKQNIPNPFTNSTGIGYTLPQKFTSAQIIITNKNGKTLKAINVSGSGKNMLQVDASTLASGAYSYSLVVDRKIIASKQMMLTK